MIDENKKKRSADAQQQQQQRRRRRQRTHECVETSSALNSTKLGRCWSWMVIWINKDKRIVLACKNNVRRVSKDRGHFFSNSVKHWPILIIFGMHHREQKLNINSCSLAHLSLILSLHYLVKCRSRILAVYNKDYILCSTCVGSEIINWIATNTGNSYYLSKSYTCYITSFLL